MKTVGLIVEYNPLHNGHVYHFQQSKKISGADASVAVMSGNFLQRGEPAIVNKWARTEMALRMGIDLVIELPVAYAVQPAEWFAYGAVSVLQATGIVDCLCFGSESGEIDWLRKLALMLANEPESLRTLIQLQLKTGVNYPAAYAKAVEQLVGESEITYEKLSQPNNILGLHYLIALNRLNSEIEPITISRQKAGYHQQDITDRKIASATAVRQLLLQDGQIESAAPYVPESTSSVLHREWETGRAPISWERFDRILFGQLLNQTTEQLFEKAEVTEGLEHRIKQALSAISAGEGERVGQLLSLIKTKRYTHTKLQRTLLHILLNHRKSDLRIDSLRQGVPYIRVLGFSQKGQLLLRRMKKTAAVPVIAKVGKQYATMLDLDIRAASVYTLAYSSFNSRDTLQDYYQSPLQMNQDASANR